MITTLSKIEIVEYGREEEVSQGNVVHSRQQRGRLRALNKRGGDFKTVILGLEDALDYTKDRLHSTTAERDAAIEAEQRLAGPGGVCDQLRRPVHRRRSLGQGVRCADTNFNAELAQ